MARPDIQSTIVVLVARNLKLKQHHITPSAHFMKDLGADSLDLVNLIADLEASFGIHIPMDDALKLETLDDVIRYVGTVSK